MFNKDKFKALVHYICYNRSLVDPSSLGAVKLNKTLWLCDFVSYRQWLEPITNARYVRRQLGPVPHQILPALRELQQEGKVIVKESLYHGYKKNKYSVPKVAPSDFLTAKEKDLVDRMIKFVCEENTATSISEISHDHIWKAAADGETIPYYTVFATPGEITAEDRQWAYFQLEAARA